MNAQTEMTEAQRQFDNKLLRLIQQHFPSIPLHGEEADKNWTRWLNFARDCAHLTKPDAGGGEAELAAALEQQRALKIVADVRAQGFAKSGTTLPTQAESIFDLACEEIEHRLRAEQWELNGVATPLTPSDVPVEPSVVPMPEPTVRSPTFPDVPMYYTADQLTAYADARVSEATRELVDGLRGASDSLAYERNHFGFPQPHEPLDNGRAIIRKYTQAPKERE